MKEYARQTIAKGLTYLTISKILLKICSLFGFFIIVANLSLKDYGLLSVLFSVLGPAAVISMLGLESVVQSDVASLRGGGDMRLARKTIVDYFKFSAVMLVVLLILSWFLRAYIDQFFEADLLHYFVALAMLIVGQLGINFTSLTLEAYEKFKSVAILQFLEGFIRFLFLLALFLFGFSLTSVLWVYVLSKIVTTIVFLPQLLRTISFSDKDEVGTSDQNRIYSIIRKHGKWEMFKNITNITTDNIWPWLVNFFVNAEAVALFSFSQKIFSTVSTVFPIKKVIFPIISSTIIRSKEITHIIVTKSRKILLALSLPVGFGLVFAATPILTKWFPQYVLAVPLLQLSALHLFIDVFALGQIEVMYALKEQRWAFFVGMIVITIRTLSQVLFIYYWGVVGVVLSWLVVSLVSAILRELVLIYKLNFPLWDRKAFFSFDEYDRIIFQMLRQRVRKFIP